MIVVSEKAGCRDMKKVIWGLTVLLHTCISAIFSENNQTNKNRVRNLASLLRPARFFVIISL